MLTRGLYDIIGNIPGATIREESSLITATLTRPNDNNAYAVNDVVADSTSAPTMITFTNVVNNIGDSARIIGGTLIDSVNQATKNAYELWLFHSTIIMTNDNAAFAISDADLLKFIGLLRFYIPYVANATVGTSGNCVYVAEPIDNNIVFKATASRNLYGVLISRNTYTPSAQEQFTLGLRVVN